VLETDFGRVTQRDSLKAIQYIDINVRGRRYSICLLAYDNYKGSQWWRPCDHQSQQDVFIIGSKKAKAKYDVFDLISTVSGANERLLRTCIEVGMNPNKPDRAGLLKK